jgi:hypothetical protein
MESPMKYLPLILSLLVSPFVCSADNIDISSLSSEEINQLSPDVLNPLPARELFNKMGMGVMYDEFIPISLYLLFYAYPNSPALEEQIQAFQSDRGFTATGVLTFEQAGILMKAMETLFPTSIYFSGSAEPTINNDFAFVTGTWTILGEEKIAFPINESTFTCYRNRNVCEESVINIMTHELDDNDKRIPLDNYNVFKSDSTINVLSWTDTEIIAQSEAECRNTTLTINSASGEVTSVTRNNGKECILLDGSIMPALTEPRVSVLVKGFDATYGYFQDLNTSVREGWSSRFQERFKSILEQMQ